MTFWYYIETQGLQTCKAFLAVRIATHSRETANSNGGGVSLLLSRLRLRPGRAVAPKPLASEVKE